IWSYSVVCVGETAKIIRWSVTTVPSCDVGRTKHPPHACESRAVVATTTPPTKAAIKTSVRMVTSASEPVQHGVCHREKSLILEKEGRPRHSSDVAGGTKWHRVHPRVSPARVLR